MGLRLLAFIVSLGVLGCDDPPVLQGVVEAEANRAVAALTRSGVPAHKVAEDGDSPSGSPAGFRVLVPEGDIPRAVAALAAEDIPRHEQPGFAETFGARSLVEGADESRARMAQATAGELAHTIASMNGVLSARVHVAMPGPTDLDDLGGNAPPPRPTASVLIAYAGTNPPYDTVNIQRLVAGAVTAMRPDDVTVIGAPRQVSGTRTGPALERYMTLLVARDSVGTLRNATVVVVVAMLASLALAIYSTFFRKR